MGWQQFIVVTGVALLVLLAWRLGTLRTARLNDSKEAEKRFAQGFPSLEPLHSLISAGGELALFSFEDSQVGAVFAVGDRFATRLWRAAGAKPGAILWARRAGAQTAREEPRR